MFNQMQYKLENELYHSAMKGLKHMARQAITENDFELLLLLAYELDALDDCDSEHDYTYETAQQWAQLANQQE